MADREIWGGGTSILTRCPEPETCQVNTHNGQAPQTLRAQGGTPAPPSLPILPPPFPPAHPHWPEHRHIGLDTFNGRMLQTRRPFPGWGEWGGEGVIFQTPNYDHPFPTVLPFWKPKPWNPPLVCPPLPQCPKSSIPDQSDRCKCMHTILWADTRTVTCTERDGDVCRNPPVRTR